MTDERSENEPNEKNSRPKLLIYIELIVEGVPKL